MLLDTTEKESHSHSSNTFRGGSFTLNEGKTRYSAFAGTNLSILFNERGIKGIHLVGVCTNICILHTAVDAYNLGISTVVYADDVAKI